MVRDEIITEAVGLVGNWYKHFAMISQFGGNDSRRGENSEIQSGNVSIAELKEKYGEEFTPELEKQLNLALTYAASFGQHTRPAAMRGLLDLRDCGDFSAQKEHEGLVREILGS